MQTVKSIEQAYKLLVEIKKLDAKIIEMEKISLAVINGGFDFKVLFECRVKRGEDPNEIKGTHPSNWLLNIPNIVFAMNDGTLIDPAGGLIHDPRQKQSENKLLQYLDEDMLEETALRLFSFLHQNLREKRDKLISELHKMGFSI